MPDITRKKTIDYLRADWGEDQSETLEERLRQALGKFSEPADSIVDREDGTYEATLHWDRDTADAVFLHIVGFQPGEETNVVPTLEKIKEGRVDLETQAAPDGHEFLDAEVMLRVSGDHCLIMTYLARIGRAKASMRNLLRKTLGDEAVRFDLMPVANPTFRELLNEQVKNVGFNFGFFAPAADRVITQKRTATLTGYMREMFLGLFAGTSDGEAAWREAENLQVRVIVSYDGRTRGRLGAERVTEIAERVNKDAEEEDYTITFKNGSRFTADQIKVRKEVEIPAFGKTVSHTEAWAEMSVYWGELKQDGIIDW